MIQPAARSNDDVISQVRAQAAQAVSPEMIPQIVFDVLQQSASDAARTARLQDVKLLLVEAYRSAGLSAPSLRKRPVVA
ncbi:hypothetical protein GC176_05910 [bacterium]|nr:hypothetical protein [bacterium]